MEIDLRGRSTQQFLDELEMYKDLCRELQEENAKLKELVESNKNLEGRKEW